MVMRTHPASVAIRTCLALALLLAASPGVAAAPQSGVAMLAGSAAGTADAAAAADVPLSASDYLAAAERLALRFRGYPELTGDYRISPDRFLSVPVIGRVSIIGLDLAGLEKTLSVKLSQIVQKEAFVTAEIAAYRPVFVTGAVRNPGAIEWRPDLTVLQAIALVGGIAAEVPAGFGSVGGANALTLEKAVDGQKRDLATIARLEAERRGDNRISVPTELVTLVGVDEADELIAHETEIMMSSHEADAAKLATLQQGIQAGTNEIASLETQVEKLDAQLKLRIDYRGKVKDLFTKGIITAERSMEEDIKVTDLEEKITNIKVGLAKSAGTVAELQLAAVGVKRDRTGLIEAELSRVAGSSAQLAIDIAAARLTPKPELASNRSQDQHRSPLQIVRQENGGSTTISADQGSLMRPGDVLIVGRM